MFEQVTGELPIHMMEGNEAWLVEGNVCDDFGVDALANELLEPLGLALLGIIHDSVDSHIDHVLVVVVVVIVFVVVLVVVVVVLEMVDDFETPSWKNRCGRCGQIRN